MLKFKQIWNKHQYCQFQANTVTVLKRTRIRTLNTDLHTYILLALKLLRRKDNVWNELQTLNDIITNNRKFALIYCIYFNLIPTIP